MHEHQGVVQYCSTPWCAPNANQGQKSRGNRLPPYRSFSTPPRSTPNLTPAHRVQCIYVTSTCMMAMECIATQASFNLGWDTTWQAHTCQSKHAFTWQPGLKKTEKCILLVHVNNSTQVEKVEKVEKGSQCTLQDPFQNRMIKTAFCARFQPVSPFLLRAGLGGRRLESSLVFITYYMTGAMMCEYIYIPFNYLCQCF